MRAEGDPIDVAGMDAKSDDTVRKQVHDHQYPVALYEDGLTAEQINTPEAVLGVSEEGQPRRSATARDLVGNVMARTRRTHILIDIGAELLC